MFNMKLTAIAGLAGLMVMTACTDVNTPTGDPSTRTKEGAAIGAATGAVFGILRGENKKDRRQNAILGGVIGGIAGGAIGSQLDKQAAELQNEMTNNRIKIINTGSELIVRMPQDILFPVDSADIPPNLRGDLKALAKNLQRYPGSTVVVYGHTDSTGSAAYNKDLSLRRAQAVARVLINNGVAPGRIRTVGMGEDQPIASNLTPEGRAQNRRVEIVIRPKN